MKLVNFINIVILVTCCILVNAALADMQTLEKWQALVGSAFSIVLVVTGYFVAESDAARKHRERIQKAMAEACATRQQHPQCEDMVFIRPDWMPVDENIDKLPAQLRAYILLLEDETEKQEVVTENIRQFQEIEDLTFQLALRNAEIRRLRDSGARDRLDAVNA